MRTEEGLYGEAVVEWAPPWLHNEILARSDYIRATVRLAGYLPLVALDTPAGRNRFSLWLAGSLAGDWLEGEHIPADVRATMGGTALLPAPGGAVRGYEPGRFDGTGKVTVNAEVRSNLPALILPGIVPGLFAFTDAAVSLDAQQRSPLESENTTVLLSSGGGFSIDLFEAVVLTFYTTILWTGPTLEGRVWVPFSIGFGRHF